MYDPLPQGLYENSVELTFVNVPYVAGDGYPNASADEGNSWEDAWNIFLAKFRAHRPWRFAAYPGMPGADSDGKVGIRNGMVPIGTSIVSLGKRQGIAGYYTLFNVMLPDNLIGWLIFRHARGTSSHWEPHPIYHLITSNRVYGPKGPLIPINIIDQGPTT